MAQNRKYDDILKKGEELFWKYGIKRVSIEEICREAGVSKMTFYKYFPNKIELAKAVYKQKIDEGIEKFIKLMDSDLSFAEKLEKIFLMKLEGTKNISLEFINDIYNNPESGMLQFMEEQRDKAYSLIIDFYKNAQRDGNIRKDVKIDFILAYSNQTIKMMEDKNLLGQYESAQEFIMESMNLLFYGIVTKEWNL